MSFEIFQNLTVEHTSKLYYMYRSYLKNMLFKIYSINVFKKQNIFKTQYLDKVNCF